MSRFPVAFRLPAFASRSSDSRRGNWALLTVGLPGQAAGPRRGYRVSHARAATGVGASSTPRTAVLFPAEELLNRRLPLLSGQSLHPATASHRRGSGSRGINGGLRNSPVRSSPRLWPLDGTGPLGLPPSFEPRRGADDARRGGARPRARAWNYAFDIISRTSNLRVHSQRATSCRKLSPGFAPRRPGADDARRGGDRPSNTNLELLAQHHIRVDPPIV